MTDCDNLYERALAAADAELLKTQAPAVKYLTAKLAAFGIVATVDPRKVRTEACGIRYHCYKYRGAKRFTITAETVKCPHMTITENERGRNEYQTHNRSNYNVKTVADLVNVLETARECASYVEPVKPVRDCSVKWWFPVKLK